MYRFLISLLRETRRTMVGRASKSAQRSRRSCLRLDQLENRLTPSASVAGDLTAVCPHDAPDALVVQVSRQADAASVDAIRQPSNPSAGPPSLPPAPPTPPQPPPSIPPVGTILPIKIPDITVPPIEH